MIRWSPEAADDFERIRDYISLDSVDSAQRQLERILDTIEQLGRYPLSGKSVRAGLLREIAFPPTPYVIQYKVREEAVLIARIYHGAQKRRRALKF